MFMYSITYYVCIYIYIYIHMENEGERGTADFLKGFSVGSLEMQTCQRDELETLRLHATAVTPLTPCKAK